MSALAAALRLAPTRGSTGVAGDIEDLGGCREALLRWYDANHRLLPWRINRHSRRVPAESLDSSTSWGAVAADRSAPAGLSARDFAYGVLVSEVMLQQTQVERTQAYFVRWMQRWPTLQLLALATEEEVTSVWAGLGYYRRARFLLQGAQFAAAHNTDGGLPATTAELLRVPGIGPYTAAAVASIAFGQQAAAVDGNVVRVLSRLHALLQPEPTRAAAVKEMQGKADALLDPQRPGDWNQAMMELGATVCTPRAPRCSECPVSNWCTALAQSAGASPGPAVTDYPTRAVKAAKREERVSVRVVEWRCDARSWFLLMRRPEGGLLAGMWEFPSAVSLAEAPQQGRLAQLDSLLGAAGLLEACSAPCAPLGPVQHVFSHVRWRMEVEHVTLSRPGPPPQPDGGRKWVELLHDADAVGELTGGQRKVFALLQPASSAATVKRKRVQVNKGEGAP